MAPKRFGVGRTRQGVVAAVAAPALRGVVARSQVFAPSARALAALLGKEAPWISVPITTKGKCGSISLSGQNATT